MKPIKTAFRYALTDAEKTVRMMRGTLLDNALPDDRERLKRVHERLMDTAKQGAESHDQIR